MTSDLDPTDRTDQRVLTEPTEPGDAHRSEVDPVASRVKVARTPARTGHRPVTRRWPRRHLPWLVAAAGLLGTVGFATAWQVERSAGTAVTSVDADGEETGAMLAVARDFSAALTNFDGAEIDADVTRIADLATGEFRTQLDTFFSSDLRTQLKEAQASSRGEVRDAYVQRSEGDRGTVFVVVDQTIANNRSPQPQADTMRMELGLLETEAGWRVNRVSVISAPTGASTLPTTGEGTGPASDQVGG